MWIVLQISYNELQDIPLKMFGGNFVHLNLELFLARLRVLLVFCITLFC